MSGSPEKRRDCLAQLPLRSTSGGSKFASEHPELEKIVSRVWGDNLEAATIRARRRAVNITL